MKCMKCKKSYPFFLVINPFNNGILTCRSCGSSDQIVDDSQFFNLLYFPLYAVLLFGFGSIFGYQNQYISFLFFFLFYFVYRLIVVKIYILKKRKHL